MASKLDQLEGVADIPQHDANAAFRYYEKMWKASRGKIDPDLGQILVMLSGKEQEKYFAKLEKFEADRN
jgi:hypothetical protein